MNILVIPDVHGRTFWQSAVEKEECDKIVFLGDYVDPYPMEGISTEEAIDNLRQIIRLKQDNPEKVVLLWGNHDLHYTSDRFLRVCGGCRYDREHAGTIRQLMTSEQGMFQLAYETEKTLFTHAGYMRQWGERYGIEPTAESINSLLERGDEGMDALAEVSCLRGGWSTVGSVVWSDVNEKLKWDGQKLKNVTGCDKYQVFGHTMQVERDEMPYGPRRLRLKETLGHPLINPFWSMIDNGHAWMREEDAPIPGPEE